HADRKWFACPAPAACWYRRASRVAGQVEVHQTLDGVHAGHDDSDMRSGAQTPSHPPAAPAVPMLFHLVVRLLHEIDMQQAVHGDIQYLHEAAELDHGGDETLKSLPDALEQIAAFEVGRDVTVGLVRPLLELGSALAQAGDL